MRLSTTLALLLAIFAGMTSLDAQTWTWENPRPQGNRVNDVSYRFSTNQGPLGWMVGDGGTVMKANAGSVYPITPPVHAWFVAVAQSRRDNGWFAGGDPGTILYTGNYGRMWTVQYLDSTTYIESIWFGDANHGWATGRRQQGATSCCAPPMAARTGWNRPTRGFPLRNPSSSSMPRADGWGPLSARRTAG